MKLWLAGLPEHPRASLSPADADRQTGQPPWVVPETVSLTQTVTHRDEHGRLLSVEIRTALGARMEPVGTVHVVRLNGVLRDRLNALTCKTHAFAKRDVTWDGLVGLQFFDHTFHRAHQALRLLGGEGVHRYLQLSPAMAGYLRHPYKKRERANLRSIKSREDPRTTKETDDILSFYERRKTEEKVKKTPVS